MNRRQRAPKPTTPLASTSLDVTINDLVAEYVLRHRFENKGKTPIEAVFSFPVPLDAAFLGMRATLGGETLVAEIQPQRQASRTYDDAIAQGDSAVLLRAPEPGVICTSLGNLLPGETGEIELRFVTALRVADRSARFSLPLVHRPRYGIWRLEELETPTHDFAVEHPLSATIRVQGLLASAPVACSTHAARFAQRDGGLELTISHAMLDRDLVLTFELSGDLAPSARLIADGDASLGVVSFVLPRGNTEQQPLDLCLVLDGSGSMAGDAIEQSRLASGAVIDALGDQDRIQVLRFGSSVVPMFRRPLLATARVRDSLRKLIPTIEADLGGTDMGEALELALDHLGPAKANRSRAIILVTDGAVQAHDIADAQAAALAAGVRIFVVAVGSSAGAEVLGPLAEATRAVLERAVPAEPIDAGVMRQFRRARDGDAVTLDIHWPSSGAEPIAMGVAYPGDAIQRAACLPRQCEGDVSVRASSLDFSLSLPLGARTASPNLRALIGQQHYRLAGVERKESIALHYGLMTDETSAVLVKVRLDGAKAEGMPDIVQVPQMLSDGMASAFGASVVLNQRLGVLPCAAVAAASLDLPADHCYLDIPAFSRRETIPGMDENCLYEESSVTAPALELITIPRDQVRDILTAIHATLLEFLRTECPTIPALGPVIEQLPVDMQSRARGILQISGIDFQFPCVELLIALNDPLGRPPLSDEDEASLAVAIARILGGEFGDEETRSAFRTALMRYFESIIRDGVSAPCSP